jgi:xanthine dehydrogenase YagS FAD-binding subunit
VRPFGYLAPPGPAAAAALVAGRPGAAFLAGGTNLVDLMKLGVAAPDLLVDVTGLLPDGIEDMGEGGAGEKGSGLAIGAGVRNSDLAADPRVRAGYPALAQAVLAGASGQLRNMATVGGNLLQRTRCLYFQDVTKPCNKRAPGSGCPALDGRGPERVSRSGEHRNLAILGGSPHCAATHPSDMAVALAALDAVVHVLGTAGPRTVPLSGLYRLPGGEPDRETTLGRGDLITAVEIPALAYARNSVYRKVRDRASYAFGVVSVAAALDIDDGVVRQARLALGAVAPLPWRARAAERVLAGRPATAEWFGRAADAELAAADPLPGNAFKVTLARNVMVRALGELAGGEIAGDELAGAAS